MGRFFFTMAIVVLSWVVCCTCTRENDEPKVIINAVTDVDGNTYDAVRIGQQVWMKTNLRTKHFRNGKPISHGDASHILFAEPYFFEPTPEDIANQIPDYSLDKHGLYYSRSAIMDKNGLCPKGWHVPLEEDWLVLGWYLYKRDEMMKSLAATTGWKECADPMLPGCHPEQNNTTGFSALPTGYCLFSEQFFGQNEHSQYSYPLYNDFGRGAYLWSVSYERLYRHVVYVGNFQYDMDILVNYNHNGELPYDSVYDCYYKAPRYDWHIPFLLDGGAISFDGISFPVRCIRNW